MQNFTVICVGKLKEKEYAALQDEYTKRLSRFCRCEIVNIEEQRLPQEPAAAQIEAALAKEAEAIRAKIPKGAKTVALCIEGEMISSPAFSQKLDALSMQTDKLCFLIGGSCGLDESLKKEADFKLSFSKMTFPHHLFRIMLLEQLYRACSIRAGTGYHK
ncbi:MAG: 23S rRNA (pseudouridine(1915)-N(3))-methyltransferase RlmH [Oscillospiraceae bacterium]|nr:23S rRNA (pseudouridine(1915)-N(3))-methyltransferase RlmH [Oscillospiraceae bacterium]